MFDAPMSITVIPSRGSGARGLPFTALGLMGVAQLGRRVHRRRGPEGDRDTPRFVNDELEDIRPRVVADRVEIEAGARDLAEVELGSQDCLALVSQARQGSRPSGPMMQLPPRDITVSGSLPKSVG